VIRHYPIENIHRQWYVLLIKLSLHIFLSYFYWLSSQEYNLLWQQSHIWKKTDSISRLFSHRLETRDTGHIETKKSYLSRGETYSVRRYLVIYLSLSKINSILGERWSSVLVRIQFATDHVFKCLFPYFRIAYVKLSRHYWINGNFFKWSTTQACRLRNEHSWPCSSFIKTWIWSSSPVRTGT
jgi:hypothetical protein